MVRRDYAFVFKQILKENSQKWLDLKNYYYQEYNYSNYLYFLSSYCIDNDSPKCRYLINELFNELGISKNQHKKNIRRHISWKT